MASIHSNGTTPADQAASIRRCCYLAVSAANTCSLARTAAWTLLSPGMGMSASATAGVVLPPTATVLDGLLRTTEWEAELVPVVPVGLAADRRAPEVHIGVTIRPACDNHWADDGCPHTLGSRL